MHADSLPPHAIHAHRPTRDPRARHHAFCASARRAAAASISELSDRERVPADLIATFPVTLFDPLDSTEHMAPWAVDGWVAP
eukprot:4713203-Prymnesium_polylepis.1